MDKRSKRSLPKPRADIRYGGASVQRLSAVLAAGRQALQGEQLLERTSPDASYLRAVNADKVSTAEELFTWGLWVSDDELPSAPVPCEPPDGDE